MTFEEMAKKATVLECDEVFSELEKMKPRDFSKFYFALEKELYKNAPDEETDLIGEWKKKLSPVQYEKLKWLNSSDREREYLMSIPEDEMTDQDRFDLRACDF